MNIPLVSSRFCLMALLAIPLSTTYGFMPHQRRLYKSSNFDSYQQASILRMESTDSQEKENSKWLTSQIETSRDILDRLDDLESSLQGANSTSSLDLQRQMLKEVEKDINSVMAELVPPTGLSMQEYENTIKLFFILPPEARLSLVRALGLDDDWARDYKRIPDLVTKLYQERDVLTPQTLTDSLKNIRKERKASRTEKSVDEEADEIIQNFFDGRSSEEREVESTVNQLLNRVVRKEGVSATEKELEILMNALDSSIFIPKEKAQKIPGGYVIRGQNRKSDGQELIDAIDAKLPNEWDGNVCYTSDITAIEAYDEKVLLLLHKDFSPITNEWIYRFVSGAALATALLFSVGIYGSNDAVANNIYELNSVSDLSGFNWLNGKIADILLPLGVILASHEIGHVLVAKNENIQTSSTLPTLLPFYGNLPLAGSLTRITSSPKNLTALFDFAFMGPLLGFISSFIFLGIGLLATDSVLAQGPEAAQFLPALPVSVLRLSTLGGTIIDNFFGGNGYILLQDPKAAISLHPYVIAGFSGLLINAIEMLPLGSTDGGRLSQALFGRQAHTGVGGATWLGLFIASFILTDGAGDVLVTAWIINNFVQNDMEVPCRDETDKVNLPRILAVMSLWFVSVLTFIPLT